MRQILAFRNCAGLVSDPNRRAEADGFVGEVLAGGMAKAMTNRHIVPRRRASWAAPALLVINPPYGFEAACSRGPP